VRTAFAHAWRG
jgi:hypothetical protein